MWYTWKIIAALCRLNFIDMKNNGEVLCCNDLCTFYLNSWKQNHLLIYSAIRKHHTAPPPPSFCLSLHTGSSQMEMQWVHETEKVLHTVYTCLSYDEHQTVWNIQCTLMYFFYVQYTSFSLCTTAITIATSITTAPTSFLLILLLQLVILLQLCCYI